MLLYPTFILYEQHYMNSLFIRQIHWDIPCRQASIKVGIQTLHQAIKISGSKTTTAWGSTFFYNDWQEFKIATHGGRQVLMLLEVCRGESCFTPLYSTTLEKLVLRQREYRFSQSSSSKKYTYSLFSYTPFRPDAHRDYQLKESFDEKKKQLAAHLAFHLSELAHRISNTLHQPLRVEAIKVRKEKKACLGGVPQTSFDLQFSTNLFIPEFLGLGQGASMGLGVIRPLKSLE